ncbi:hypothetical protein C5F49_03910 [Nitrosopumilus oxyclinae]|uniref:DUF7507 domain-containing protein n=1 Tax=Nitrosopumilus oxyclinae TaxID=1959104 RepID=A0A7D5QZ80_9ARCH|nr:hypothetical protein [Nitrosopumilus oxyclinae]QLH04556.1 hypothetical protein C5F49_03910 [Nitrosopumilus oxyclinae]
MPKNRRGLSSVVGALFFTVLMIAGFSVLSLALDAQTDIVTTQRIVSDLEIKKQQEQFGLIVSTDANNFLDVGVNNFGQNPVEISSIWITNKTLPTQPVNRYDVNYDDAFVPSGFTSNVVENQILQMIPDTYDIKVISSFGTIKVTELTVGTGPSSSGLRAELVTDPPDVIIGQNVTIAMVVTNTGNSLIKNVEPDTLSFVGTGSGSVVASSSHTPPSVDLDSGASVMFTWDYQVTGASSDLLTFSAVARGDDVIPDDVSSNVVSDVSILRLPTDGGSGENDPDIINEELLARPKLFLTIPSSQGDSGQKALWGVNIANPVNAPMEVTKLSLTAFSPGANNNDKLFASNCQAENIFPTGTNDWDCPSENIIMWQDFTNPVTIPPNSTESFLVKVLPGSIAGQNILESIVVQASVFTNVGSFGKSGYQSTMYDGADVIGNVYLSDTVNSVLSTDIQSSRVGIIPNSVETFNIVFADLDTDDNTFIDSGGKLIINIPKEWTDVTILGGTSGFVSTPSVTVFGDGSTQIIGITSSNLGTSSNVADTIQFSARAPNITNDQMYVMYVLAQGQTDNNFSVGPLSEIVLQVDGS